MSATLRPGQSALIDQIDQAIEGGCRRIMVQAPTGYGKTVIAGTIANNILDAGKRAIFTAPALSLIDQTVERFYSQGVWDVGVIQAQHPLTNYARPIQVASVQTLARRKTPPADLIMIDEAHRWFDFYSKWLSSSAMTDVPVIGLSATPWTRGLGKYFDRLIIAATTQELIDDGHLSKFRAFAPASPDLTGVRTVAGDYHEGDLAGAVDKESLVADVVTTWLQRADGRPTLCFAVNRIHANHLQQKFVEAGVVAGYIDAFTPAAEREAIKRQFHAGEIKVVCNVGCLTTGIDWDVRCIILARPTKSEMLFVQMIGRGLRTADGKDDCLILDHSDNHTRLGFVTDIHHHKLDDGTKRPKAEQKAKEKLPKPCPACTFMKPPEVLVCPACGFAPKPQCLISAKEGELVELSSRREAIAANKQEQITFYSELRSIAQERSYKGGWAAQQYKTKFGKFPPWEWNDYPTLAPKPTTRSWVKSRQIAFARRAG
jgi:superfamily II DNA or RNA helicase